MPLHESIKSATGGFIASAIVLGLAGCIGAPGSVYDEFLATGGSGTGSSATGTAGTGGAGEGGAGGALGAGAGAGGQATTVTPPSAGPTAFTAGYVLHVQPSAGVVTVAPTAAPAPGKDRFADAAAAPDGVFTLTTDNLRTDGACPDGFKTQTVCFDIHLSHTLSRSLSNVFGQVVDAVDPSTGKPPINQGALNYDPSELGLVATRGLWKFTAAASTNPGVLGAAPDDSAVRTWVFASPKHTDLDLSVRVVAALGASGYAFDYSTQPFVDACASGQNLGHADSSRVTLPFPFSLYGVTASEAVIASRGTLTMGPAAPTMPTLSVALPDSTAPWATAFGFWDDIVFGGDTSAVCTLATGAAPNRSFVVTWKEMDFAAAPDSGAHLTFSLTLREGSGRVDVAYDEMSGPTVRSRGATATVGVQNEARTAGAGEHDSAIFRANTAYSFIPHP